MSSINEIKAVLAEINEDESCLLAGRQETIIRNLTKALEIAVDALKDIEEHYEHPNDLQNINSARLRGCQLEAKNALEKISEIMEEK